MDKQEQQQLFQDSIAQHKGILFKVARAYCSNEDDREDLRQEMMVQIWQSMPKYNAQFKMSTWLYRISLNTAISFYRKNANRIQHQIPLGNYGAEIPLEDTSDQERQLRLLEQFVSELKEIDKALMLLYLEDKSHAEISEILGLSISNVGTKITRIKEHLKTRFSQLTA